MKLPPTPCRLVVIVAALAVVVVAWQYGSQAAGGADSFGYLSQATLWREGDLHIAQALAARVPWPHADWTLTPLGYVPGRTRATIVPMYAPGLPLLMAAAQVLAGPAGPFWLQPLAAGLLVICTYGLLTRLSSDRALGATAALLMATSPTLLFNMMSAMSDTVNATLWTASFLALTWPGLGAAALAGALGGTAVLVRPNLVPLALAGLAAVWMWAPAASPRRRVLARAATYAAFIGAAAVFIAATNTALYGSPLASGYSNTLTLYGAERVPGNVLRYARWLFESQGVLVVLALAPPALWAMGLARPMTFRRLLPPILASAIVAGSYLLYVPFDVWWYLRFVMPALPWMFGATAFTMLAVSRRLPARLGVPLFLVLLAMGLGHALRFAGVERVLHIGEAEQRYISMGRYIDAHLAPDAVIVAMQHSGSVRYYAGRATVRWDWLERDRLRSALEWLRDEGRPPFLLLDDSEVDWFQRRFAGVERLGSLDLPVVAEVTAPVRVRLFDPLGAITPGGRPADVVDARRDGTSPGPQAWRRYLARARK